jgi:hypothetical protein
MWRKTCDGEIVARGYAEADVRRVVKLIRINEYKRRQSPVGIRITIAVWRTGVIRLPRVTRMILVRYTYKTNTILPELP